MSDFATPCFECGEGFVVWSEMLDDKSCDNPDCRLHQADFYDRYDAAFQEAIDTGKLVEVERFTTEDGEELISYRATGGTT